MSMLLTGYSSTGRHLGSIQLFIITNNIVSDYLAHAFESLCKNFPREIKRTNALFSHTSIYKISGYCQIIGYNRSHSYNSVGGALLLHSKAVNFPFESMNNILLQF